MEWLAGIVVGFAALRWLVALLNWLDRPVLPAGKVQSQPLISVLVPARNEAGQLPHLFGQFARLSYPNLELLVLDDHSEDATAAIVAAAAQKDPRIRLLRGAELPADWLGKNWACHQLAQAARGELLLFFDADIAWIHPALPEALLAQVQRRRWALISLFPDQIMQSWGEKIIVPMMHELLLSLLPLRFIAALPFPSMAAANGQCMAFDGEQYRQQRWHEQVKTVIVEDIAIMQRVKQAGLRGMTYVGGGWIRCRMYQSYREGLAGFSKNLLAGFGNSLLGMFLYLLLISVAWVAVGVYLAPAWLLLGLILVLHRRVLISDLSRQPVLTNVLLHPLMITSMLWIGGQSAWRSFRGTNTWKGRNIG